MKRRVLLAQVNQCYGRNTFLPYSVGCLQAYAQTQRDVAEAYEFLPLLFLREDPEVVVDRHPRVDVLGLSSYIWNEQWNLALARAAREAWPNCLIVLGGPQAPERMAHVFLLNHPEIDILVHHEGEHVFTGILRQRLMECPHYGIIPGLTYSWRVDSRPQPEGTICFTGTARRIEAISDLPSPYLAGVFDSMPWADYDFHATQETHRGCPYACTFCDWGSAIFTKVRAFDDERLEKEIRWFADHQIELLYNADANYGLLARDLVLTDRLAMTNERWGYPKQFRAAYAKNSNERIFKIATILHEAEMSKGVTLSLQSTDPHTLEIIKRKNIAMDDFEGWVKRYEAAGIGTYTELILGLPGETYDTFADGIDRVLASGQHHGLYVYLCMALPNSEMSDPAYVAEHGIRTVHGPLLQQHATPDPTAEEMADIVIGTKTMPEADWLRAFLFSWAVQTFHCLGLTTQMAIAAVQSGSSYRRFYEGLLDFFNKRLFASRIGDELLRTTALAAGGMAGGPWGTVIRGYGDVVWPAEEATFLWLLNDIERVFVELAFFLRTTYGEDSWLRIKEAWHFDRCHLITPTDPPYNGDTERYGRETLWYGRKTAKQVRKVEA
jgi:putative methyltransferase